jgi:pimeloyl-ACP methyl ester carboxylesterase
MRPRTTIAWPETPDAAGDAGPATGCFALSEGGEVEVAAWGRPPHAAPTLLLLHEGLGCVALWRDFPVRLAVATGCGVVAYSRLGYGASSPVALPLPLTHMVDEARSVLPQLVRAIGPATFSLFGHSDGATIVAHYLTGDADPRLAAAVLIAPHFFVEASNLAAIRKTREAYEAGDLRARLAKYHGDNVDGAFYGFAETWCDPAFRDWDMRYEIERWHHPVLFIQGRDDPYGSSAQAAAAGHSPCCRVAELDGCAHAPHLEQPRATLDLITTFLAREAAP